MHLEMQIDAQRFNEACEAAMSQSREGIGELREKTLHRTLKHYFEPNTDNHEISFLGSVADIKNNEGIIEIQTRSFDRLVPKLARFLPEQTVTVVYPIVENRRICRVDPSSGESHPPRRSPKRGRASDAIAELAKIRDFLTNKNLRVLLAFIDATEIRMSDGYSRIGRKKTDKIDIIPTSINSLLLLKEQEDYRMLLPKGLGREFTSTEFSKATGFKAIELNSSLKLLLSLGILKREKQGRRYVYTQISE